MEPLFAERDLQLIAGLEYDPALEPAFDEVKACLVWDDERPSDPRRLENTPSRGLFPKADDANRKGPRLPRAMSP